MWNPNLLGTYNPIYSHNRMKLSKQYCFGTFFFNFFLHELWNLKLRNFIEARLKHFWLIFSIFPSRSGSKSNKNALILLPWNYNSQDWGDGFWFLKACAHILKPVRFHHSCKKKIVKKSKNNNTSTISFNSDCTYLPI